MSFKPHFSTWTQTLLSLSIRLILRFRTRFVICYFVVQPYIEVYANSLINSSSFSYFMLGLKLGFRLFKTLVCCSTWSVGSLISYRPVKTYFYYYFLACPERRYAHQALLRSPSGVGRGLCGKDRLGISSRCPALRAKSYGPGPATCRETGGSVSAIKLEQHSQIYYTRSRVQSWRISYIILILYEIREVSY